MKKKQILVIIIRIIKKGTSDNFNVYTFDYDYWVFSNNNNLIIIFSLNHAQRN